MKKERKRLIERLKHVKHGDWRRNYYFALNSYVMSKVLKKSPHCQREFGKYMIRLSVGMRYGYGYTFARLRGDIRRRTDLWESALRIGDPHAINLCEYIDETDTYDKLGDWKDPLRERGYEGLTIYQSVFPRDIEHKKEVRQRPKNRYKWYFKRHRKAEKLKKARKKNWKSFEPKEIDL